MAPVKRLSPARPLREYVPGLTLRVADEMQECYAYTLEAEVGRLGGGFAPWLTPPQMLALGVFEGKYLNDCRGELPAEWYEGARGRLSRRADPALNCFRVKSRKSLQYWREKGWIPAAPGDPDVRGWFQWYCRYFLGRRLPALDAIQIRRWKSFARHRGQILAAYRRMAAPPRTLEEKRAHRPKQRQALLQWAYDPWV